MATTGRSSEDAPAASDVAGRLRDPGFVRIVGAATGDALAASGVLARTLDRRNGPFQVSIADLPAAASRETDADLTVAVGRDDPAADLRVPGGDRPASATAYDVARRLWVDDGTTEDAPDEDGADGDAPDEAPDGETVALALAGVLAADREPSGRLLEDARAAGIERRPGVSIPGTALADGLAHSTLVRAPFSGDVDAAAAAVDSLDLGADADTDVDPTTLDQGSLDEADRRRVASMVALRAVGSDDVEPRGGESIVRALRPFHGGPFDTVDGYADVLDAVARERPGTGVALALGHDVESAALDAWRSHARRTHETVERASTQRHDGLYVVRADRAGPTGDAPESDAGRDDASPAPVGSIARLVHAYRSPEPVTLVVADGVAAAVSDGESALDGALTAAADATDGEAVTGSTGRARFATDVESFVAAFKEAR